MATCTTRRQHLKLEINADDAALRRRLIKRYKLVHNVGGDSGFVKIQSQNRPFTKNEGVAHFLDTLLNCLILNGYADNDVMIENEKAIAKEMRVSVEVAWQWHDLAWDRVQKMKGVTCVVNE